MYSKITQRFANFMYQYGRRVKFLPLLVWLQ